MIFCACNFILMGFVLTAVKFNLINQCLIVMYIVNSFNLNTATKFPPSHQLGMVNDRISPHSQISPHGAKLYSVQSNFNTR